LPELWIEEQPRPLLGRPCLLLRVPAPWAWRGCWTAAGES